MTQTQAKYQRDDDGLFHCKEPGCEDRPGWKHPQHMGLHMYHNHGIKGTSRRPDGTPRTSGGTSGKRMGRPPKARPMLSADDVCSAALEAMAPNGSIPIAAIPYYNAWVDQTRAFFVYLLG